MPTFPERNPSRALLAPHEPAAYEVLRPDAPSPFVLTCDHAGKRIPEALGDLGLPHIERERHIAWDRGAAALARGLSRALEAPLILQTYSRLVIDCNRPFANPDSVPERSEDTEIPGNCGLEAADMAARRREIFAPYHDAIAALLDRRAASGQRSVLIAVHSFTPVYRGEVRPWDVCLLYHRHRPLSAALLAALGAEPELCVGDNVPYQVDDESDYGVPVHGEARGLANALIEVRQDHLETEHARTRWVERLAAVLPRALEAIEKETR